MSRVELFRRKRGKSAKNPLPSGWLQGFHSRADFERSFAELEGQKHFYAEAMRGHIRSFQLRFAEGWKHFDRAYELSQRAAENIPNLVRQFLLNIYCFEHALLEEPLTDKKQGEKMPSLWLPALPDFVLEEYPEVKLVINLRRHAEGILCLHLGKCSQAARVFEGLTRGGGATAYLGLAAAQHGMGNGELARSSIENAARILKAGGDTLDRARAAAVLQAFYTFLAEDEEANSWKIFIEGLPCPLETHEVFLRRAGIILERSRAEARLLVL